VLDRQFIGKPSPRARDGRLVHPQSAVHEQGAVVAARDVVMAGAARHGARSFDAEQP
jgi:hypothetical protein